VAEGTAIVDSDDDDVSVFGILDEQTRSEGQISMGAGQFVLVETFSYAVRFP
jgi:hypothetical protein